MSTQRLLTESGSLLLQETGIDAFSLEGITRDVVLLENGSLLLLEDGAGALGLESLVGYIQYQVSVSEAMSLAAGIDVAVFGSQALGDTYGVFADAVSDVRATHPEVEDVIVWNEQLLGRRILSEYLTEIVTLSGEIASKCAASDRLIEAVEYAEALVGAVQSRLVFSEPIPVDDALSSSSYLRRSIAESLSVNDSLLSLAKIKSQVEENIATYAALSSSAASKFQLEDSLAVAEAISSGMSLLLSEVVVLLDSLSVSKKSVASVADSVTLSELPNQQAGHVIAQTETVTATESVTGIRSLLVLLLDSLILSDTSATRWYGQASLSDSVSFSESIQRKLRVIQGLPEFVPFQEVLFDDKKLSVKLSDTVAVSELVSAVRALKNALSEAATLSESVQASTGGNYQFLLTEFVSLTEELSVGEPLPDKLAESVLLYEQIRAYVTENRRLAVPGPGAFISQVFQTQNGKK